MSVFCVLYYVLTNWVTNKHLITTNDDEFITIHACLFLLWGTFSLFFSFYFFRDLLILTGKADLWKGETEGKIFHLGFILKWLDVLAKAELI